MPTFYCYSFCSIPSLQCKKKCTKTLYTYKYISYRVKSRKGPPQRPGAASSSGRQHTHVTLEGAPPMQTPEEPAQRTRLSITAPRAAPGPHEKAYQTSIHLGTQLSEYIFCRPCSCICRHSSTFATLLAGTTHMLTVNRCHCFSVVCATHLLQLKTGHGFYVVYHIIYKCSCWGPRAAKCLKWARLSP